MSQSDALHNLRLARAYAAERLSWFAPALFQCRIILTERVDIAAIDQDYNIYFNPVRVLKIRSQSSSLQDAMEQLGFLWIHEISHVLRDHSERSKERNAESKLWNVAADLEINDSHWAGLRFPDLYPGLLPRNFRLENGKLAEWYYNKLLSESNKQTSERNGKCDNCGNNKNDKNSKCENCGSNSKNQKGNGKSDFDKLIEKGIDEGSGVHGEERPWEESDDKQKVHPIEKELVSKKVAEKMQEYAKQRGTLPGNWAVWVEEIIESKTDWRKILRHRMSTAIATGIGLRVDYSFQRPSRRQSVYAPIVTPSFSGSRSGSVAIVVDTSGSMMGREIHQAIGEVCKVLEDFKLPVTIIPCDARAYDPIILKNRSDIFKLYNIPGGGGTDMTVGIDAALKIKPKPDTILVLTDGHTPYPKKAQKVPVIFGIIARKNARVPRPPNPPWNANSVVDIFIE